MTNKTTHATILLFLLVCTGAGAYITTLFPPEDPTSFITIWNHALLDSLLGYGAAFIFFRKEIKT